MLFGYGLAQTMAQGLGRAGSNPAEYANPSEGYPTDDPVSISFATTRSRLAGWLKQPCLSPAEKDALVESATKVERYLVSLTVQPWNPYRAREAGDWASIIDEQITKIKAMKICGEVPPPTAPPPVEQAVQPPVEQPQCLSPGEKAASLRAEMNALIERFKKIQAAEGSKTGPEKWTALEAGIWADKTLQQWRDQMDLLNKVRENPGQFTPENWHPRDFLEELEHDVLIDEEEFHILQRVHDVINELNDLSEACADSDLHASLEFIKNWGRVQTNEYLASTGELTDSFSDSGDPIGIGIVVGEDFRPWHNGLVVGPFASLDYLHQTINHTFAAGTFLGTTTNWIGTAGVKLGVARSGGVLIYSLGGISALNETLNINFGGPVSSANTTVFGGTLGLGVSYDPEALQRFGRRISLFAQYQHTWWETANLNQPAASPLFDYAFHREDDTVKLGLTVHFGEQAPEPPLAPPARAVLITK